MRRRTLRVQTTIYYLHQYNNHAYLWSTENGYDFFVEQQIGINRRNINNIAKLLRIYGTDSLSEIISDALQGFEYGGRRASDLVRALKREGAASTNTVGDRRVGSYRQDSFGAGDNAQSVGHSETQAELNFEKKYTDKVGNVIGYVKDGKIFLDFDRMKPETPIHEYTHLWANAIQKKAPELWKNIKYLSAKDLVDKYLSFVTQAIEMGYSAFEYAKDKQLAKGMIYVLSPSFENKYPQFVIGQNMEICRTYGALIYC